MVSLKSIHPQNRQLDYIRRSSKIKLTVLWLNWLERNHLFKTFCEKGKTFPSGEKKGSSSTSPIRESINVFPVDIHVAFSQVPGYSGTDVPDSWLKATVSFSWGGPVGQLIRAGCVPANFERVWHVHDSQGQLAVAFRSNLFKLFSLRSWHPLLTCFKINHFESSSQLR